MGLQRKPVQIAVAAGGETDPHELYALAHDGSIWRCCPDGVGASTLWERVPALPEGKPCGSRAVRVTGDYFCELVEGHAGIHYSSGVGAF